METAGRNLGISKATAAIMIVRIEPVRLFLFFQTVNPGLVTYLLN